MSNLFAKWKKEIKYVLYYLFAFLMLSQVGLGVRWITWNVGTIPVFSDTDLYVQAAETLVVDEYMGILYPVLIRIAKMVEQCLGISYAWVVYAIQVITAIYAIVYMLKNGSWINGYRWRCIVKYILITAYVFTFPILLQLHFAILPYSLVFSLSVIIVSDSLRLLKKEDDSVFLMAKISVIWILMTLLIPEYCWIGGIFVILSWSKWLKTGSLFRKKMLICVIAIVFGINGIGQMTQTPGSMGRIQRFVESSLLQRIVWPNFVTHSFFWPEEINEVFSVDELSSITQYREGVIHEFGPQLEYVYGKKQARELYMQMAMISLGLDTKQILADTCRDFLAYLCPQVAFQVQRQNNQGSLLPWNYGQLQEKAPLLTKYYVNCSLAGWNIMCIIGLAMGILKKEYKNSRKNLAVFGGVIFLALWYTMQGAGAQDYKQVMLISLLWLLPVVKGWLYFESETECEENKNE